MTDLLEAAILGVVQGLTEFLPISSTGHLILTEAALGIKQDEFGLQFDAAIHLGTLAAVLVYFRGLIASLVAGWLVSVRERDWDRSGDSTLAWLILLGTVPAAIAGYLLESSAEDAFRSPPLVAAMLLLFCIPMVLAERSGPHSRDLNGGAGPGDAVRMGVAQSVALIPGVSRSGITISAGMLGGLSRESAAVFTFLLSGPIIAAAGGKQLFDALGDNSGGANAGVIAIGMVTAGVVGYAAIAFLLRFLRTNSLYPFVVYRVLLAAVVLAAVAAGAL